MANVNKKQSCSHKKQMVYQKDLPLRCPPDASVLWNAHPKVYLPIEKTGQVRCPYCGTLYTLKNAVS
ncbi:MAG: zinc-finger domain-containing protein [Gammaproteobacteria bacterium]|nr:zinc-finger domain-containing protein [Gammaproteobacteria bacterium]MCH9763580.1 zinc-finger domain-containing protein [Gammaproteobacteria bacterium]